MVKRILKPDQGVNFVLNKLRMHRRKEKLISARNERNLHAVLENSPEATRHFLGNLLWLHDQDLTPYHIGFPAVFRKQEVLEELNSAGPGYLKKLMGPERDLNLGRAGFAEQLKIKIKERPSLTKEIEKIEKAKHKIAEIEKPQNEMRGNWLLFRALLAARFELLEYEAAKKDALKKKDRAAYAEAMVRRTNAISAGLSRLLEIFPFGRKVSGKYEVKKYRRTWKVEIGKAESQIGRPSNVSADNILVPLLLRVLQKLNEQEIERVNRLKEREEKYQSQVPEGKLSLVDKQYGKCILRTSVYKKSADGSWKLVPKDRLIPLYQAPGMFDRWLANAEGEKARNTDLIRELKMIWSDPPKWCHRLYVVQIGQARMKDPGKRKLKTKLWGATHLSFVSQKKDQPLMQRLLDSAVEDVERRNEFLEIQIKTLPILKAKAEEMMAGLLKDLAKREADYFVKENPNLREIETLKEICDRLGSYFGTLLAPKSEEHREMWIRQARSRVTGALKPISKLLKMQKANEEFDEQVEDAAIKAARSLLEIEFIVENRQREWEKGERKKELHKFFRRKAKDYGNRIIPPPKTTADQQMDLDI